MARDKVTETNALTGETIEREMTVAEQKERDDFIKAQAEAEAKAQAEAEAKATSKAALLAKLGITAEEAVLLLS